MGTTAIVVATGPSLTPEDAAKARAAKANRPGLRIVTVNDAARLIPDADIAYAADAAWWIANRDLIPTLAGQAWTQALVQTRDKAEAEAWAEICPSLYMVESRSGEVPSFDPTFVARGQNSGFQAVNLAVLSGASRIILLGFDMQLGPAGEKHYFGDHPKRLNAQSPFPAFVRAFERAAPVYANRGIVVLNATRRSALKCFRQTTLDVIARPA